ncbi:ExeM/NucH family extracellular endonuclease [Nocardioides perillae]|uniref:Putative extracellular nuclease n=1 Tax=Nocardioides perillae TaxID=1119534 RepID=A0A7Y9RUP0_9ACTN|nr:ExeM/NucH family extracellular endonuclease [Nocardioides perillae]NYG55666.1 putative extracellular nuclease [Nocardioides perillae]
MPSSRPHRRALAALSGLGLAAAALAPLAAAPAAAAAPADHLVISEVYGGGGNSGATFTHDFVELFNPTDEAVDLSTWSVQYRSASGTSAQVTRLGGNVAPGETYLVQMARGAGGTTPLPEPDATGSTAMSGTAGQVILASSTAAQSPTSADPDAGAVVDFLGWGGAAVFEGSAPAPSTTNSTSVARTDSRVDTDDNRADFTTGAPTPGTPALPSGEPEPEPEPERVAIADVQGDGAASPLVGREVTTTGVVTALYATGGYDGFYLQTAGTGSGADATPGRSDAVFVYAPRLDLGALSVGQHLEVTGEVSEFFGLTELSPGAQDDLVALTTPASVTPLATTLPRTAAEREAHEGELVAPQGPFTVTNSFQTNRYAEVGLAAGTEPLVQPTDVVDAQDTAGVAAVEADNAARAVTLDDGASTDFQRTTDVPLPYLTAPDGAPRPVRVGAPVTFLEPVVLDFRNSTWKLQPTTPYTADERGPVAIADTREDAPEDVGGDLRLATFNVLNYFNTTGADFEAAGGTCTYYRDRAGDEVTNNRCEPNGPRGAAEADDLERQQAKIVAAINALDAGIVSLEEIENSVALGEADRDDALKALVRALNADAGAGTWDFVRSPDAADLPPVAEQDVIRTAFIYQPALVRPLGASQVLDDPAFDNAREPLAQLFRPVKARGKAKFAVVVNHFKSKGSGTDDGTGQGNANPDRIAQAEALAAFADRFADEKGTDRVFLVGDFNAYTQEDPMQVLYAAGYTNLESDFGDADGRPGEATYSFSGLSGSLDHVLASPGALEMVTGVDVWGINAGESLAFEYSRANYNVTQFYAPDPFRSSDHDPELVGLDTTR